MLSNFIHDFLENSLFKVLEKKRTMQTKEPFGFCKFSRHSSQELRPEAILPISRAQRARFSISHVSLTGSDFDWLIKTQAV